VVEVETDDPQAAAEAARKFLQPQRTTGQEVARQGGLSARAMVEGVASLPAMVANVPAMAYNAGADLIQGDGQGFRFPEQNQAVSQALTSLGVPQPENATERVVQDIGRTVSGAGSVVSVASRLPGAIAGTLAANPGTQLASATGSGAAGGATREMGGGPLEQFVASILGGVAAPFAVNAANRAGQAVRSAIRPQDIDAQVQLTFENAGVDWRALSESARRQLVEDAKAAVATGRDLDDAALRRLADFRAIGATPLRGDVTQDPRLITQERNLAKTQANMGATAGPDLGAIQNANAQRVLTTLDEAATSADDAFATGQGLIGRVREVDDAITTAKNTRYTAARKAAGQDIPLSPAEFINQARTALDRELKGKYLPAEISSTLDDIATGKVPFDVRVIDILKTDLARASRGSSDGNVRAAVGIVRNALESAEPRLGQFGTTTPVTGAQGAAMNQASQMPAEALRLLDRARKLAATQFKWQESLPFIEDALGGAQPDKFVQKHVINGSVANAAGIRKLVGGNAPLREAVRAQIIGYLKQRGGADSDVTRFSSAGLEKGIEAIGRRKLLMWFKPDEVQKIESAVRVAKYMQSQPMGAAVNNSNSGALVVGKALDALTEGAKWFPGARMVTGANAAITARSATDVGGALVPAAPRVPLPATPLGLAAVPPRDDDRRD
jgi:hypothetical protein